MKRLVTFIITIALLIGFSQCKKKVEEITPVSPEVPENFVYICVNAGHGDKHIVYPETRMLLFPDI